ncbi:DUF2975 domain-containing protein [Algoriphagus mannitolivorans]|uniref:DUF2975 domain-containing protein n=1 Tax=Algoriphagus mannitolivorans TaxID=226504 RepID=UPI0004206103|nr:DUF2975 domain-containing protein [Algoriphagus mannitolivorans]
MEQKTEPLFSVMKVFAWIAFIGLSVETGSILVSFVISLIVPVQDGQVLYRTIDLSELHLLSLKNYLSLSSLIVIIYGLKAYLAYLVIRIFDAQILTNPFQEKVVQLISKLGNSALQTGITAFVTNLYITQFLERRFEIAIPINFEVTEFIFLAGIIFVLSKIFKKGVEIQSENELTV